MQNRTFRSAVVIGLASVLFLLTACEPTPGYLRRWANRDGSEEMFAEYLVDPDVSHDVHVTALELLIEQWDYSAAMLRNGGVVSDMPDPAERDATIRDATPRLRELYDSGGSTQTRMRDAAFHIRQATDDDETQAVLEEILNDWLTNHWSPCTETGAVSARQLLEAVGQEAGEVHLVRNITEGTHEAMLCQARQVQELPWLSQSDAVATAYTARWDQGDWPEDRLSETQLAQLQLSLAEEMLYIARNPIVRQWLFSSVADNETSNEHKILFLNLIQETAPDDPTGDIGGFTTILQESTTVSRWSAFEQIVNINGSQGLEHALSSLPADSEYGYWQGRIAENGFARATAVICGLERLAELGDNTRPVFEAHINDENIYARAMSIKCLETYGNAGTVEQLQAALAAAGEEPIVIPRWAPAPAEGEAPTNTIQALIQETIAAIQAR